MRALVYNGITHEFTNFPAVLSLSLSFYHEVIVSKREKYFQKLIRFQIFLFS